MQAGGVERGGLDRSATWAAPMVSVLVAYLFENLTRSCVPPRFALTFSRNVWLVKLGVAWTAPFTVVDRNDAPHESTHDDAGVAAIGARFVPAATGADATSTQAAKTAPTADARPRTSGTYHEPRRD